MKQITILGGGPGGYTAAIRAAQQGLAVTLIEKSNLGGTCLNWGCIPTKAWIESAHRWQVLKEAAEFGLGCEIFEPNLQKIVERKNNIVDGLVSGLQQLMKKNKINVIEGEGDVLNPRQVKVKTKNGEEIIDNDFLILATGSKIAQPPIKGIELPGVINSDQALELTELPQRLVVVGGGVVGMEFAGIFAQLGSQVTVVEVLPRIIAGADDEMVRRLTPILKKSRIEIKVKTKLLDIDYNGDELVAKISSTKGEEELMADNILMAAGRNPNLQGIDVERLGLEMQGRFIKVNEYLATNLENVYAIGDIIDSPMLAHVAAHEGEVVVSNILDKQKIMEYHAVPSCVYIKPELAWVGLTEQEAKEQGFTISVGKFSFNANGRSLTLGESMGQIKIIADEETGIILGGHILGPHASELISELTLAVQLKLKAEDVAETIHAHPTLSEAIMEAAQGVFSKPVHIS